MVENDRERISTILFETKITQELNQRNSNIRFASRIKFSIGCSNIRKYIGVDSFTYPGNSIFPLNFRQFCRFSSNERSVLSQTQQRDAVKYETSADNNWSGTQAWRNRREGKRNEGDDKTHGKKKKARGNRS